MEVGPELVAELARKTGFSEAECEIVLTYALQARRVLWEILGHEPTIEGCVSLGHVLYHESLSEVLNND